MKRISIENKILNKCYATVIGTCVISISTAALAQSDSRIMLQLFESDYENTENRIIDIWHAGYQDIWVPPTGRADLGDFSVGYDVYNRFDLGDYTDKTLYGTSRSLKQFNNIAHRAGLFTYADSILNHNGFSDNSTNGFLEAGDYPGFVIEDTGAQYGDFHDPWAGSDWEMRVAGLIDIAQEQNLQYIRNPVDFGDSRNIPAGTIPLYGRLADVPDQNNKQFYPDLQGEKISFRNTSTGEWVTKYRFNTDDPMAGDAVVENATGLLLRYTQWMNEVVGFDGFRIDAMKHIPNWFFDNYYDNATYMGGREMLNGERINPFSFGEVYDGDNNKLLSYRSVNGFANREVLDFSLFFSLQDNLTGNGLANDWRSVVGSSVDLADNGYMDGSAGVKFVQSHDNGAPALDNVAYAYSLLLPGRSIVYYNAKQFGSGRDFPLNGRGDALGGIYGDTINTLTEIANSHGRGAYYQRHLSKETLVYERDANLLVGLSNRIDSGYDTKSVQTNFKSGTLLVELTGHAGDATIDPDGRIDEVVQVDASGNVQITVPRNTSTMGQHNLGYVVYGPNSPKGFLNLTNVSYRLDPDAFNNNDEYENGNHRLNDIAVIENANFDFSLQTQQISYTGYGRDRQAEGDNAIFRFNGGVDTTGQGFISTDPNDSIVYGYQQITDKNSSLWSGGDGEYRQTVDASQLTEGMNYLTVRAFRHRDAGEGSAIFTDFQQAVYLDLLPPETDIIYPNPVAPGSMGVIDSSVYEFVLRSVDGTANSMHLLLDAEGDPYDLVSQGNKAAWVDRDEFRKTYGSLQHGSVKMDLVAFELTGNYSVLTEWAIVRLFGLGDLNHDGKVRLEDFDLFGDVWGLSYLDPGYDPSADFDDNGYINAIDYGLFAGYLAGGVPTPASGFLLTVTSLFMAGYRPRRRKTYKSTLAVLYQCNTAYC